ncbi:conjugal transfer protein TraC [Candidatus Wolfebacteria bacterium RIFCSPHIGHO2_01_FULL_48_22]|uniref:Conjugal transfer protein TraC n=2 Tax=Candidatus Wolfeibacteriota TaxID=1752735 RepID=A0A1F8DPP1_9BACT|nr:MAG: conjugal transfer protein TraC [Candidatus Wolfebacteria bacterium RIFCSPHIGHO2_01_FULL_48_22]OGM92084.1 MAG: conjugal transfer protein TraC [Candidatus Wolfebacteria bacterium RIFCSPLOWO2_01_FULL_47_17b]
MEQKIRISQKNISEDSEVKNLIAPAAIQSNQSHLKVGNKFAKTFFVFSYPRYLSSGWFSPIINLAKLFDISIFVHPVDTALALRNLRKKAAQVEAEILDRQEKGYVRDPMLETAFGDIEGLRDNLQQAQERLFDTAVYVTIYAETLEKLQELEDTLVNLFESKLIYIKPAIFQQVEGLVSTLPLAQDKLAIHTPLNSGPVSSFFPFTSMDLTSENGIMYGINLHNNSLVLFDRFSLENANQVVFAKSGSGKSYATKLEILRTLMMGTEVIVVDPEKEYKNLCDTVGGTYFNVSLTSDQHINPFDIPFVPEGEDPADVFRSHILTMAGLLKIMLGDIAVEEEALLDRAISETYSSFDITPDNPNFLKLDAPLLSDFETVLRNMEGGKDMAERLYKYTQGSYAGFVNQKTNIDVQNRLVAFSIRDLEDELRPIAMYVILNFIWNLVRSQMKRRILVIDEAWVMMKYPEGAAFLFGMAKRGRKYYLGLTTITQEVDDFLNSPYGKPIITNSSLQLLLKQAPATIDTVAKTFNLTEAEKNLLLEAGVGQGVFFAGLKHVAMQVVASYFEDKIITTKPQQLLSEEEPLV